MDEKNEKGEGKPLGVMLTAEELLRNKGIRSFAWREWEESKRILPRTGQKQFEPNDSWLQHMQIDKGIKNCRDLLSIERVERNSQLACAEWLPVEKKARVTKKSGQDWSNFGLEKNGALYLIPEEALLLLEMNSLELTWNGVPMSIQQAYDRLIDNEECHLEEYRVYSQLVRYGYKLQRFLYEHMEKKSEENTAKKKVIVEPENGLRMVENFHSPIKELYKDSKNNSSTSSSNATLTTAQWKDAIIKEEVCKVIEDLISSIENTETLEQNSSDNLELETDMDKKNKNKIEIISEEMLLDDIKIVKNNVNSNDKNTNIKWSSSRIQRNVKLLPKRSDKPDISISDPNSSEKRKTSQSEDNSQNKRQKLEVIVLSDDEIQELPRPMTRMEMLNLIPNIAQPVIILKISRGYIPHNVKPQKSTYEYERKHIQFLHRTEKKLRASIIKQSRNNITKQDDPKNNEPANGNAVVPFHNQVQHTNVYDMQFFNERTQFTPPFMHNRFPFGFHNPYWHSRSFFGQQNMFQNTLNFMGFENFGNTIRNRCLTIQMNNFGMPMMERGFMRNQYRHSFYHNFTFQQKFYQQRALEGNNYNRNPRRRYSREPNNQHSPTVNNNKRDSKNNPYQTTFRNLPGASSWAELKKKWREEKTIVIDEEDSPSADCNEVEVVREIINPLIGCKNASNLAEVYDKLRIIKSASEKIPRRKRGKYKISYNVYPSGQHYKKTNPGVPLYRIVVIRQIENTFIQPIELNRLQQDAKDAPIMLAYVSTSISYVQPGIVSLPYLT